MLSSLEGKKHSVLACYCVAQDAWQEGIRAWSD